MVRYDKLFQELKTDKIWQKNKCRDKIWQYDKIIYPKKAS